MGKYLSNIGGCSVIVGLAASIMMAGAAISYSAVVIPDNHSWQKLITSGDDELALQKLVQAEACYREALKVIGREPHAEAEVVRCIEKLANTLAQENKIDEALPFYQRSLHLQEKIYGKESSELVPTLFAIGSIYESEGDPKPAMALYQRALAISEKHYGPFSPSVADSLHFLGRVHSKTGETQEAEHDYKTSLSILMQQPSLSSSSHLESLLADYHDLLRKNESSDSNLISDFQTEVLKDHLGPKETTNLVASHSAWQDPVVTAPRMPGYGQLDDQLLAFQKQGLGQISKTDKTASDKEQASAWQKQIAIRSSSANNSQNDKEQQVLLRGFHRPFESSTEAPAYDTLADVLHNQHPYAQGEDQYKRMIALDIKVLGPDHPAVADDLTALALLYISQQRYKDAKPLLIRALSIYKGVYGNDNLLVKRTVGSLAFVLEKLGETEQAVSLYKDVLTQADIVLNDPNGLETARILNQLGFLYYRQGKLENARTIYQWALASTEGAVGNQDPLVAACLTDYANVLRSLGRVNEADQMQERAIKIFSKRT
jgi:tetratricopeptide (TPR) repeat protein